MDAAAFKHRLSRSSGGAQFIYLCGCDGSGKSTHARTILTWLHSQNRSARLVWIRFPFFVSVPLLAYARWRGFSWYESVDNSRQGHWDFSSSAVLRRLFPWSVLADAWLAALLKIYLPLRLGQSVVCERFVVDMIVDQSIAFQTMGLHRQLPWRLYFRLIPKQGQLFILDVDSKRILARRPALSTDKNIDHKIQLFRQIAQDRAVPLIDNTPSQAQVEARIRSAIDQSS